MTLPIGPLTAAERKERTRAMVERLRGRSGYPRLSALWSGDDGIARVGHSGDVVTMLDDMRVADRA